MDNFRDRALLKQMQSLPLDMKIKLTQDRIREWYNHWGGEVYVSFSGGKDSTVLLDISRRLYPDIEAVFVDTGLEYPEIRTFVKGYENVTWLRPRMNFREVITTYGYPVLSKGISHAIGVAKRNPDGKTAATVFDSTKTRMYDLSKYKPFVDEAIMLSDRCCYVMKKQPLHAYQKRTGKQPITAQMASESQLRTQQWLRNGCNAFDNNNPISNPMSFWLNQDVLQYIKQNSLAICPVYGEVVYDIDDPEQERFDDCVTAKLKTTGCDRTGCIFCGYGAHLEKNKRFIALSHTHTPVRILHRWRRVRRARPVDTNSTRVRARICLR